MMKSFCTIIALAALGHWAWAQPALLWEREYGGSGEEIIHAMKVTPDGGFIAAGHSASKDGHVSDNFGDRDFWVVKFNRYGIIEWERNYGGSKTDQAKDLEILENNTYAVLGYTNSNDGQVKNNSGNLDTWLILIDSLGNLKKEKEWSFGNEVESEYPSDLLYLGKDTLILAGRYSGHIWVLAFDLNSKKTLWNKDFPALISGGLECFVYNTKDGFITLTGTSFSDPDDPNPELAAPVGLNDFWLIKLDKTSGNKSFDVCWGGTNSDILTCTALAGPHSLILSGLSKSSDVDVDSNKGESDWWTIYVKENDSIRWKHNYGGNFRDAPECVQYVSDGGCLLFGYVDTTADHPFSAVRWLLKLNESGQEQWALPFRYASYYITAIEEISPGEYLLGGTRNHNFFIQRLSENCLQDTTTYKPSIAAEKIICEGAPLSMHVSAGSQQTIHYTWDTPRGIAASDSARIDLGKAQPGDAGFYSVVASIDACHVLFSDSLYVQVLPRPTEKAVVQKDTVLCGEASLLISALAVTDTVSGRWQNAGNALILSPDSSATIVSALTPGSNFFAWTLSTGSCPDYDADTLRVIYQIQPAAHEDIYREDIRKDTLLLAVLQNDDLDGIANALVELSDTGATVSYALDTANNILVTGAAFREAPLTFLYKVCSADCPALCDSARVAVIRTGAFNLTVPGGITPNNDGLNECLVIDGLNEYYPENEILIYNRWGDLVFRESPYTGCWDARGLPSGAYYYMLHLGKSYYPLKGSIQVFR